MVSMVKIVIRHVEPTTVIQCYEFSLKATLLQSGSGKTSKLTFKLESLKLFKLLNSLNGLVPVISGYLKLCKSLQSEKVNPVQLHFQ